MWPRGMMDSGRGLGGERAACADEFNRRACGYDAGILRAAYGLSGCGGGGDDSGGGAGGDGSYQERPQVHPLELRLHYDPKRDGDNFFPLLMAVGTTPKTASEEALGEAMKRLMTILRRTTRQRRSIIARCRPVHVD